MEQNSNSSNSTNTKTSESENPNPSISNLKKELSIKVRGTVQYAISSFGAGIALPFMMFNGMTTIFGAGLLLPVAIGYPLGFLLSVAYFIVVTSIRIKKEHPLRRLFLIAIFGIGSTYTSFFSIYEQMSEGQLKYQSAEKTVIGHNKFINDLRISLNQRIKQVEQMNSKIVEVNSLKLELEKIIDSRAKFDAQGMKDAAGELAGRITEIRDMLKSLALVENSYEYQLHQELLKLQKEKEGQLRNNLSTQTFIENNLNQSQLFAQDESLYKDIIASLDKFAKNPKDIQQVHPQPNYDDYIKTPIFLVPMEVGFRGGRQSHFIFFAIIISISMEIIPILLSGIHLRSKNRSSLENNDPTKQEVRSSNFGHVMPKPYKNSINQISEIISSFILNSKKALSEVGKSISYSIGTTDNIRDIFSDRLIKAMDSAKLSNHDEKYDFLRLFYSEIDHNKKEISLLEFSKGGDIKDIKSRQRIAASLFLDIMQDKRVRWLQKSSIKKFQLKSDSSDESERTDKIEIQVWRFSNEDAYQDFLDWWLYVQSNQICSEENIIIEQLKGSAEIIIDYAANSRPLK